MNECHHDQTSGPRPAHWLDRKFAARHEMVPEDRHRKGVAVGVVRVVVVDWLPSNKMWCPPTMWQPLIPTSTHSGYSR